MVTKVMIACAALALLTGCASSRLVGDTGRTLTYEHDNETSALMETYRDAAANCKAKGLYARQTSTVCPDEDSCITKFACLKR